MDQIVYDEGGTLLDGVFYEFDVPFGEDIDDSDADDTWIHSRRTPSDQELLENGEDAWMWIELLCDLENVKAKYGCSVDKSHVTEKYWDPFEADVLGGARLSEFIPTGSTSEIVVSAPFASRLKRTILTGFETVPVKVIVNQATLVDPMLFVLQPRGRNCLRPMKVQGAPNACPFCGRRPLICPACGYYESLCSQCGNTSAILSRVHRGEDDKRLKIAPVPQPGRVLDGAKWDGSDFINCGWYFITRRALDWLLSIHAAPFYVRPARVCIDGMSEEQLRQLEAAKSVASLR